ncbi:MAG: class I SAM-dependent methyltransferase [Xanthomonadales bacterium]
MGLYSRYVLPHVVHYACGQKPAMKQRRKIIPLATGRVLEVGIGSGLNIPFYDPDRVEHLWGLDPSREMWAIAQRNARVHHLDAEFIEAGAESIPLDNGAADTVVITYTLCTIPQASRALGEIRRVLKPRGRLIFCEHGEAPDEDVRRWQRRMAPAWQLLGGGCRLNRPIPRLLETSGFRSRDMASMYIPGWKPACFNYWGTAEPV